MRIAAITKLGRDQEGAILTLLAFLLIPLLGMAALVIDIGRAYYVHTEFQNAADDGALSGVKILGGGKNVGGVSTPATLADVQQITRLIVAKHLAHSQGARALVVQDQDIEPGIYNFNQRSFQPAAIPDPNVNAVRVTLQHGGANPSIIFQLAQVLGFNRLSFAPIQATAVFAPNRIALILDASSSMAFASYWHEEYCYTEAHPFKQQRDRYPNIALKRPELTFPDIDDCLAVNQAGALEEKPQPMYDILITAARTLLNTSLFQTFYRSSLIVFGSQAHVLEPMNLYNRAVISNILTTSANDLLTYAQTRGAAPSWSQIQISPGLALPHLPYNQGGTGYTNPGAALQAAIAQFTNANAAMGTQAIVNNIVPMLVDGEANCRDFFGNCANNDPAKAAAANYALTQAAIAAQNRIAVYPILWQLPQPPDVGDCNALGLTPQECDRRNNERGRALATWATEQARAAALVQGIANASHGQAFQASTLGQLQAIFQQMSQKRSFVLVP